MQLSGLGILLSGSLLGLLFPCLACALPTNTETFEVSPVDTAWQQNAVTTIIQSRQGYLWLGTYHGLVRFDGVRSTVFDSGNAPGLQNGRITSLFEDASGKLWIGHETGDLTQFVNDEFHPVPLQDPWPGGPIEALSTDEHGDLWLLNTTGFLFRLRDGKSAECPGGASPSQKATLTHTQDGTLWIASAGKIATLENGNVRPFEFDAVGSGDFYEHVFAARDGGIWVVGSGRVRKWRGGRWVEEATGCPREPGAITVLLEARSGALLAGTLRDGLYLLPPGSPPLHFSRTNHLSQDWVRSLCEDHEGNLWIGTGAGFDRLHPRLVTMLNPPDEWQGCAVLSLAKGADDSVWVGTEGAGLYRYREGQWTPFREANGIANVFVWSVLPTRKQQLLVGTWGGGLFVQDRERFLRSPELSLLTSPATSLFQAKNGDIWIGTTSGLHHYQAGRLTWSAGKDKLSLPDVRAIAESPDGTIWFGMLGGGLGALKDGNLKQFRRQDGLSSDFVFCLYAEPDGTLWIGTADNGLTRLKNGVFATISRSQGLPNTVICHFADDGAGNLWMSSHRGILRANKAELNQCADRAITSVHFQSYGTAEGLSTLTCSGGFQPGACRAADGRLWFSTARGIAVVDPANITTNTTPPPVVIEDLLVDGTPIEAKDLFTAKDGVAQTHEQGRQAEDGPAATSAPAKSSRGTGLRIPAGHQRFEIHYTALSFAAPEKVRFKYKLDGLESEWMDAGSRRVAEYSYLPPGTYRFQVIACNNDGVWNEAGAGLSFVVLPLFWQTWWFQALCLIAGAALVAAAALLIGRHRVRTRLEQLQRQRAVERERSRIARDIHDDLGASLTRITLLSDSVRGELNGRHPASEDVEAIFTTARQLTRAMDEIVWAVNPKHDTLDSLITYLGRFAQNFLSGCGIRCRLDLPLQVPGFALTAEVRHNVFLAFKEGLHNVVKHAGASEVRISLEFRPDQFLLIIKDNGLGFDLSQVKTKSSAAPDGTRVASGNGLFNMRQRLEDVGGTCEWETAPQQGTRVKLGICITK